MEQRVLLAHVVYADVIEADELRAETIVREPFDAKKLESPECRGPNQVGPSDSLPASGSSDPCLRQRIAAELEQIEVIGTRHAARLAIVPWVTQEPVGPARLLALARSGAPVRPPEAATLR